MDNLTEAQRRYHALETRTPDNDPPDLFRGFLLAVAAAAAMWLIVVLVIIGLS